jgi:hypothetical protein
LQDAPAYFDKTSACRGGLLIFAAKHVFVLAPIIADPPQLLLGRRTAESATSYRAEIGTKIVIVPRGGGEQRQIDCPPLVYVHINNAFEDRGDIVIDLTRYNDDREFFERPYGGQLAEQRRETRRLALLEAGLPLLGNGGDRSTEPAATEIFSGSERRSKQPGGF